MFGKENIWGKYVRNIMASDVSSAIFLAAYMKQGYLSKNYALYLEVIDLQKYRLIKHPAKVKAALQKYRQSPFVFFIGKN